MAAGLLAVSIAVFMVVLRPDLRSMVDLQVYRAGGDALRAGAPLYDLRASKAGLGFTYPPFAAILFVPLGLASLHLAKLVTVAMSLACLIVSIWIVTGPFGGSSRHRAAVTFAVAAASLWFEPVQATLSLGQINLVLMTLILFDLTRADTARWKGLGVGLAAGIKLTPVIFIAYLALTRRLRAAVVTAAAAAGTIVVGWAAAPESSSRYWCTIVLDPTRPGRVENSSNQTIRGMLARLLHTRDVQPVWLTLAAVVGILGLAVAVWAHRRSDLLGALACAITGLLVSPISWSHHWVWIVPVTVAAVEVIRRQYAAQKAPLLAALAAIALPFFVHMIWWPPYGHRVELNHHGTEHLFAAAYIIAGLAMLAFLVAHLLAGNTASSGGGGCSTVNAMPPTIPTRRRPIGQLRRAARQDHPIAAYPERPAIAWGAVGGIALIISAALVAMSGRYGYHRDELYFLRAGQELAFGYVDQPPLTPLLARLATEVVGDSLVGIRLASAVAAGLIVVCTGLLAREFGGGRAAQALAAGGMAVSAYLVAVGHLLSTSTFDLLAWTALSWLVARAMRDGGRSWLLVGLVAGSGLQNKTLVAFLLAGLLVGLLLVGPRSLLRTLWPWLAGAIAMVLWAPYLIWQAVNGWPQLELSAAIASGSSGTSESRWLFLPMQLGLVSPLLVPIWLAGLWRLIRDPELRPFRMVAVAYGVLAAVFLATGGKPYYLGGLYPALLAAGAEPTVRWLRDRARWVRSTLVPGAISLSAAVSAVLFLPLVPVESLADTPIPDINYDAGETVGWPAFARSVAHVYDRLPDSERKHAVVLTRNYGQAGAIDRYGDDLGLPQAYSGHNSYASWGPPPDDAETVVVIGYDAERLRRWFGSVDMAGRIDNGVGLDNDEQGTPIWICRDRLSPWSAIWPELRHIG